MQEQILSILRLYLKSLWVHFPVSMCLRAQSPDIQMGSILPHMFSIEHVYTLNKHLFLL